MFVRFGGYLYANISMARIAAARAPGLSIDDIDAQYSGVGVLPPHKPRPGERSPLATLRLSRYDARGYDKWMRSAPVSLSSKSIWRSA